MARDLTAALHALTEEAQGQTTRRDKQLPAAKPDTVIPPRTGASGPIPGAGGASGIASPLVETDYADRTFHDSKTVLSTDGVIALRLKPVKIIKFKDALKQELIMEYKAPP